jgi:hypothetical protein
VKTESAKGKRETTKVLLHVVASNGFTLCCQAMTTYDEDGVLYCKGCFEAVANDPGPAMKIELGKR